MMRDENSTSLRFVRGEHDAQQTATVYRCRARFEDLEATEFKDVLFCGHCEKGVYRIIDINGFMNMIAADRCVWIDPQDRLADDSCEPLLGAPAFSSQLDPILLRALSELDLRRQWISLFQSLGIHRIGDLIQCAEADLLKLPNLSQESLNEIKEALASRGLQLDTRVEDWPSTRLNKR